MSDLLKRQQANLTHQENILEGQSSAQKQEEKASHKLQRELKQMIANLTQELDEKSKKQMELHHQNLNLQEALKKAANFSGMKLEAPLINLNSLLKKLLGIKLAY